MCYSRLGAVCRYFIFPGRARCSQTLKYGSLTEEPASVSVTLGQNRILADVLYDVKGIEQTTLEVLHVYKP